MTKDKRTHRGFEYCPSCEVKMRQTGRRRRLDRGLGLAGGRAPAYVVEYECPSCENRWEASDIQRHLMPSSWE